MKTYTTGLKPVRVFTRTRPHSEPLAGQASTLSTPSPMLQIIPFGGVEEVGINMTAYEYGDDIIVVDMGLGFPPSQLKGVNYIIPNYQWLEENKTRIRAILVTHAHLDHIGGIPYILPRLGNPPIYSMPLSIGFIKQRLNEFDLDKKTKLHAMQPNDTLRFGNFTVEFFRVNHNIPDSVGLAITSPAGRVIHTGDWKLDFTPRDHRPAEMDKLARWGGQGVLALLSDSTGAKKSGYCASEAQLHASLEKMFREAKGRIIFSSNALIITRIQQVLETAAALNRKVVIVGRSMQNNIEVAASLGYLKIRPKAIIPIARAKQYPDNQVVILTTGAQGENNAGLARMARSDHRDVQLKKQDTIIISSTPIPGNEGALERLIATLTKQGISVLHHKLFDIHVSGHAHQEELKMTIDLVRPQYLIPIHGEHHMLTAHAQLAQSIGMPPEHIFVPHNGSVFEFDETQSVRMLHKYLPSNYVLVDETAVGQVDPVLFCDKEMLATAGVVSAVVTVDTAHRKIIGTPEVITRGFIYAKTNGSLLKELEHEVKKHAEQYLKSVRKADVAGLETELRKVLQNYIVQKTQRQPLVLPVVVMV